MLTPAQLADWAGYYAHEAWGPQADDQRHGILAATIARCLGSKTAEPRNFMLRPPPPEEDAEIDEARVDKVFGLAVAAAPAPIRERDVDKALGLVGPRAAGE